MIIRQATVEDEEGIERLNALEYGESRVNWKEIIQGMTTEMCVYVDDDQVVGYSTLEYHESNRSAWVVEILVHPVFRRQGIASQMLDYLVNVGKKSQSRVLLAQVASNNPAVMLFEKNGWRMSGYNDRFYASKLRKKALFYSVDLEV